MYTKLRTMTRIIARMLGSATIALMAGGQATAQSTDMLEIRLALGVIDANFNPTNASVFKLAETLGFYERHGVKVTIIALDGTPQAVAALNSGAVDIADITIDSAVRLRADNDLAIRGIVGVSMGGNFLIAANSEIETVDDLRGKAYAIADNGSLDHALSQVVLRSAGVSDSDLNFVAIGAPDLRVQALAAGRIDATTVSFGTYMSVAEVPGLHVLMDTDEFSRRGPTLSKFVAALETTIETKREALQRFTNALIDTSRAMEADPDRWIQAAIEARSDLSPENIRTTSSMIASRWCINGCMPIEGLADSVAFVYANPDFRDVAVIDSTDIIDLSFTATAMETLGVAGGTGLDAR